MSDVATTPAIINQVVTVIVTAMLTRWIRRRARDVGDAATVSAAGSSRANPRPAVEATNASA